MDQYPYKSPRTLPEMYFQVGTVADVCVLVQIYCIADLCQ